MAKIILCDDSRAAVMFLERKLQSSGHTIVGKAHDGNEGFKAYMEFRPDLMLLDVTMPNRDGRACLEDIIAADPQAKVIMITAVKDDAVVEQCMKLGAVAFISKSMLYNEADFNREVLGAIERFVKAA